MFVSIKVRTRIMIMYSVAVVVRLGFLLVVMIREGVGGQEDGSEGNNYLGKELGKNTYPCITKYYHTIITFLILYYSG